VNGCEDPPQDFDLNPLEKLKSKAGAEIKSHRKSHKKTGGRKVRLEVP